MHSGSIRKFGGEEKSYGGGGVVGGKIGGLGLKKAKTYGTLTARMVETSTGEILVSAKGEGISNKGGGLKVGGARVGGSGGSSPRTPRHQDRARRDVQEAAGVQVR